MNEEAETEEDVAEEFSFVFDIDFNYQKIDRMATFWESLGLQSEVLITGAGYALVLHHPR